MEFDDFEFDVEREEEIREAEMDEVERLNNENIEN